MSEVSHSRRIGNHFEAKSSNTIITKIDIWVGYINEDETAIIVLGESNWLLRLVINSL